MKLVRIARRRCPRFLAVCSLVNAGGLMNVYSELEGYNREAVMAQTEKIFDTTLRILDIASNENTHPHEAAVRLADRRIAAIKHINSVL